MICKCVCLEQVQKPSAPWEFYICSEVHQRLQKLGLAHMVRNRLGENLATYHSFVQFDFGTQ